MNVYVRELARDLGKRGIEVEVFTRWREKDDPRIQQIGTNARVVHIPSGPIGYWPKMAVYEHLDEFTSQLLEHVKGEGRSYDIVHAHYWLSAKVARTLEQRWLILFVGRIEQIKGIDVLLRAMGLLFQRYPDLRSDVCLLVVGGALDPGDDAPETEKILELRRLVHEHRMESNVAFVGSRGQEELALYYAAADVCAVPSLPESFGLVAPEAMACGTPVVGTRVGGLQTVIENGESGLLVPAGDYRALAEAIAP